jgi:hypothetical protein
MNKLALKMDIPLEEMLNGKASARSMIECRVMSAFFFFFFRRVSFAADVWECDGS